MWRLNFHLCLSELVTVLSLCIWWSRKFCKKRDVAWRNIPCFLSVLYFCVKINKLIFWCSKKKKKWFQVLEMRFTYFGLQCLSFIQLIRVTQMWPKWAWATVINGNLISGYLILMIKFSSKTEQNLKIRLNQVRVSNTSSPFIVSLNPAKVSVRVVHWSREEIKFAVVHWPANSAWQDFDVQGEGATHLCHPLLHTAHRVPVL